MLIYYFYQHTLSVLQISNINNGLRSLIEVAEILSLVQRS